ncbi:hypothetical protein TMatcc_005551 [Talaromyces marneffei ATCC 18224]
MLGPLLTETSRVQLLITKLDIKSPYSLIASTVESAIPGTRLRHLLSRRKEESNPIRKLALFGWIQLCFSVH